MDASRQELVHVEPHLAIDPFDPDHWIVGTIVTAPDQQSDWRCAVLTSFDAGGTWLRHDFDMGRCIDPWIAFVGDDRISATMTEIQEGHEGDRRLMLLHAESTDGGRTWSKAVPSGRTVEHAMVTRDGDRRWMLARRTDYEDSSPTRMLSLTRWSDTIDSRQTVFEYPAGDVDSLAPTGLVVTGDELVIAFTTGDASGYQARSRRSTDRGETFSAPITISERCGRGREGETFGGYPFMAGDDERLWHACSGDGLVGYWLSASNDGGRSWEPAIRIDGGGSDTQVRTPMIAVSDSGVVAAAWYDRRHDPELECQHLYVSGSADGGRTFAAPEAISTESSCPNAPGNGVAGARSWNSGGDYSSLAALPGNRFAVVWADSRSGRFQLRSAIFGID